MIVYAVVHGEPTGPVDCPEPTRTHEVESLWAARRDAEARSDVLEELSNSGMWGVEEFEIHNTYQEEEKE